MNKSKEKIVDLYDLLIELLFKWKATAGITLAVMIVVVGVFAVHDLQSLQDGQSSKESLPLGEIEDQEKLLTETCRAALSDEEAKEVENVYDRYNSYTEFRNFSQKELTNYDSLYARAEEDMIIKNGSYIVSSTIEGVENQFIISALGIDEYSKIAGILDEESPNSAYKYVYLDSIQENTMKLTNGGDEAEQRPAQYMITVAVLGTSQETCDSIWSIVDTAFRNKETTLRKIDKNLELEMIDSNYSGNVYEYIISKKQAVYDMSQKVDAAITSLKVNYIDKFSDGQKEYYNLLKDPEKVLMEKGVVAAPEASNGGNIKTSVAKSIILGALLGLLVSFTYILSRYLSSGTINMGQELQDYYQIPVLGAFFVSDGKRKALFPSLVKKLLGVDSLNAETKAALIAPDIRGVIKSEEDEFSLYTVQTCEDTADQEIAEVINHAVTDYDQNCQSYNGLPLNSVEELKQLMGQKNVLLLIHNKRTLQSDVEKLLDICGRHGIKILGAVTVTDV